MTGMESTGRRPALSSSSNFVPWLIFMAVAGLFIGFDLLDGQAFYKDVDDRMRALQIRDLLRDGQWFDLRLPFITMPEPYVSPWSRLVDLPYVLLTLAFKPFVGLSTAFKYATWVWPPVLLAFYGALAIRVLMFMTSGSIKPLHVGVIAGLSMLSVLEFVPGRIDHHNFQIVLMLMLVAGLVDPKSRHGGIWTGLAVILSLAIGLECLPFLALALAGQAIAAIAGQGQGQGGRKARSRLIATGYVLLIGSLPVSLVLNGWAGTITPACDAYSLPWVLGLSAIGAVFVVVPSVFWSREPAAGRRAIATRTLSLALPGALTGAGLGFAFPLCLSGPYHMIDPVSRAFWLDRVYQELSGLALIIDGQYMIVAVVAILTCICIAAVPGIIAKARSGDYGVVIVFAMGVLTLVFAVTVIRFIRFPAVFVPLLLPLALASLNQTNGGAASWTSWTYKSALIAPVVLVIVLVALFPKRKTSAAEPVDIIAAMECTGQDMSVLDRVPGGKIIALSGLSLAIAERRGNHTVAALSFHRASPGIRRVADAFANSDGKIVQKALAPFTYLAICLPPKGLVKAGEMLPFPLYRKLVQGKQVPGLVLVEGQAATRFGLFRIVDTPD